MRQAGRYLPEYRALRTRSKNFVEFCLTPDMAIEATLQPIRRYGMDAAILFADILLVPHALGQPVSFVEGEGPKLTPLRSEADLLRLSEARLMDILSPVMATIRGVKADLPPETTLIGFAGAPWTVATYMVEGGGGSDFVEIRRLAYANPAFFRRLMDWLVQATSLYLIAQAEAGAEALQLFDTWAGAVPAPLFDAAVIAPTAAIVTAVKARFPDLPIIGFPRGAASQLTRYVAQTGVDAIGVDHMTDLTFAADAVPGAAVQGNLDPILLLAGGAAMETGIRNILAAMEGRRFLFNLGHGVTPPTPPEHVARLVEIVRGG